MALLGYNFHNDLTDSNSTSLANFPTRVDLTSSNFDFTKAKSDGSDLRVNDETAGALVPIWLESFDPVAQKATLWYKATATNHAHRLYYSNPSASSASSFSSVMLHGSGFEADWGDLATAVGGPTGVATRLADPTSSSDIRNFQLWTMGESPILQISDLTTAGVPTSGYTGLREFGILRDDQNRVLKVGGKYYAFFTMRSSNVVLSQDPYRAESTVSPYGPWSNFTFIGTGSGGPRLRYPGCAIRIGSTYYLYISWGWGTDGTTNPPLSIYYITSADLNTWTSPVQCLTGGVFNDQTSGPCIDIGNPKVIRLANGNYWMTVEGHGSGGLWGCYGATSPDGITWTAISASPLVPYGAAGTWDNGSAANPAPFQFPSGGVGIFYNGGENQTTADYQLGWATASTPSGPFTKASFNPVVGRSYGAYGVETSAHCYAEDGVTPFWVCQRFVTDGNSGDFRKLGQVKSRGGLLLSRDDPTTGVGADAAIAGVPISAGTFTAESRSVLTAHRSDIATPILIGLYNAAALPAAGPGTNFNGKRIVEILRWSKDTETGLTTRGPGDITFVYYDAAAGAATFWNGSAWSTGTVGRNLATDMERGVLASIRDDGTNYILKAVYADDGSAIAGASASIAKSACLTPTNRLIWCGDPNTDSWEGGLFLRSLRVRPYAATEPAMTLGAQAADAAATRYILTGPTGGTVNAASAAFTVAPDSVYNGTVTITPTGGGLSTPIVLTFSSSGAAQTFTITPTATGAVTLTGSNSGGLTNPTPLTYTVSPVPTGSTTWTMMALTTAFPSTSAASLGWTLYTPTGSIVSGRTTSGIQHIGNAFCAMIPVPWVGAFVLVWDDGTTQDAQEVQESYVEPGVTYTQAMSTMLAVLTGKTQGGGTRFLAPDGTTVRVQGTVVAGDRTTSTTTPIS
jgi:hypothetical protein